MTETPAPTGPAWQPRTSFEIEAPCAWAFITMPMRWGKTQKKGAKIVIECYSTEEFENVVSTLLGEYQ